MNEHAFTRLLEHLDDRLRADDARVARIGRSNLIGRRPVHTVYVPADRYHAGLAREWGETAAATVAGAGGYRVLAKKTGVSPQMRNEVAERAEAKIREQPIEDLRLDFEDGYGHRADATEDQDTERAAREVSQAEVPHRIGLRAKSLEPDTRVRGLRTLTLFFGSLAAGETLPERFIVTLPKVTSVNQVEVFAEALDELEFLHGLPAGYVQLEVQVETPQIISHFLANGDFAAATPIGNGRLTGLHFGTYDYSASLNIDPAQQRMDHPVADFAKLAMQLAAAGTDVRLSDGSTNLVPTLHDDFRGWQNHASLVKRSLMRGFTQGWDLHPLQLPTRYLAVYDYYRSGTPAAVQRLGDYLSTADSAVLDEPASARSLAGFLLRGVQHGALEQSELASALGSDWSRVESLAQPGTQ